MVEFPVSIQLCADQELKQRAMEVYCHPHSTVQEKNQMIVACIKANKDKHLEKLFAEREEMMRGFMRLFE